MKTNSLLHYGFTLFMPWWSCTYTTHPEGFLEHLHGCSIPFKLL